MRMIGTGNDPLGRYPDGLEYDLPDDDPDAIAEHVERNWGRPVTDEADKGRRGRKKARA